MEKAIKSMNIIVYWFLGLMVFYLGEYLLYRFLSGNTCTFEEDSYLSSTWLNCVSDSLVFVWWLIPIIYVFWPTGKFFSRNREDDSHHLDDIEHAKQESKIADILYAENHSTVESPGEL
jgi:hypothetical protein